MPYSSQNSSLPTLPLVLASASPRRLQLLEQIGVLPEGTVHPEIDETPEKREKPSIYVRRLALKKLQAGQELAPSASYILAADTIAAAGDRILNKTQDPQIAERHLRLLSGRRHRVYTAVALLNVKTGQRSFRLVQTMVQFSRLTDPQLIAYLKTNEWCGKAGSYAIQGLAASFIKSISGNYSNVVGLPLFETAQLLRGQGLLP